MCATWRYAYCLSRYILNKGFTIEVNPLFSRFRVKWILLYQCFFAINYVKTLAALYLLQFHKYSEIYLPPGKVVRYGVVVVAYVAYPIV